MNEPVAPPSLADIIADGARFLLSARSATLVVALSVLATIAASWEQMLVSLVASLALSYGQLTVSIAQAREAVAGGFFITPQDGAWGFRLGALFLGLVAVAAFFVFMLLAALGMTSDAGAFTLGLVAIFAPLSTPFAFAVAAVALGDGLRIDRLVRQSQAHWPLCIGAILFSFAPLVFEGLAAGADRAIGARQLLVAAASGATATIANAALARLYARRARSIL